MQLVQQESLGDRFMVYSSESSAAPEMVMVHSCVLLSYMSSHVFTVLGTGATSREIRLRQITVLVGYFDSSEKCYKIVGTYTLYLMSRVFLSDILVVCSTKLLSAWVSDEATAAGAGLSEAETKAEAACRLRLDR